MSEKSQILTGADALLELVQESNVISIGKAAKRLDRDPEQIRLFAESLEEYGKVVIYQTINDILIVDREHYVAMNGSVRGKTRTFLASLFTFKPKKRTKTEVDSRERALEELSKTLAKRSSTLEVRQAQLDRMHADLDDLRRDLDEDRAEIDSRDRSITAREKSVDETSRELDRREKRLNEREAKAALLLERARSFFP